MGSLPAKIKQHTLWYNHQWVYLRSNHSKISWSKRILLGKHHPCVFFFEPSPRRRPKWAYFRSLRCSCTRNRAEQVRDQQRSTTKRITCVLPLKDHRTVDGELGRTSVSVLNISIWSVNVSGFPIRFITRSLRRDNASSAGATRLANLISKNISSIVDYVAVDRKCRIMLPKWQFHALGESNYIFLSARM